ncbi:MAG: signal peptidase II [Oscillospiraceae bacterium]|jgi:signal peptidase II|nr:signal peptidase II [Oscillospiraceae bacterium]
MKKQKWWLRACAVALIAVLVWIDQAVKVWAAANLPGQGQRVLIPGLLGLRYAENAGISFGLFGNSPAVMQGVVIFTGIVMLLGLLFIVMGKLDSPTMWAAAVIIAGGFGNFIDRVLQGFVVDYLEFLFMEFAIFNLADVFIMCGMVALVVVTIVTERRKAKVNA